MSAWFFSWLYLIIVHCQLVQGQKNLPFRRLLYKKRLTLARIINSIVIGEQSLRYSKMQLFTQTLILAVALVSVSLLKA